MATRNSYCDGHDMNKKISIVIIVKNDIAVIDTIKSIKIQDYVGKFEVIIVDRSTIKYPKISTFFPVKWIRFNSNSKRYTIPDQRNLGISKSSGDIVVFIDASCIADPKWLSSLVLPISQGNESIVMGRTGSVGRSTLNDLKYKKLEHAKYSEEAPTINLAIHRKVFDDIGMFDETFEYGSDMDFTWRLIDAGYKIRYEPRAYVEHNWGGYTDEIKRSILYGKARPRLYLKHYKTRLHYLLGQDSPTLLYPLLILGLPIAFIFPWYLLVFPALVLKNILEPNPVGIVIKHLFYGCGILVETFNQITWKIR